MNRETENRIQKANNVSYQLAPLLRHSDIPMETKSKIINSIFVPTHIPVPNLDHEHDLRNEMPKESYQQDQKRHDPEHQDQRNGRNKEHPLSYPTAENQMVWTPHKTANPTPSSTCIKQKIQWPQSKRTPPEDLD